MRILLVLALALVAGLSSACAHRARGPKFSRPTGTCAGACDLYLWCKAERGQHVAASAKSACELECADVFSGADALAAFEGLSCEDAIAFVEGESGRGPGEAPASASRPAQAADGETSGQRASSAPAADEP
jgi:hypothetical protein